ncbi:MAG: 2-dehydropantoate 2-reductase [Lachnospiraceae bacterium]|nr:2-dehydropantoate 2-reductase [Lachnospiraceae bacterium]
MKITVIGPGAMGLLFGGKLAACADVTLIGSNPKNLKEINENGVTIRRGESSVTRKVPASAAGKCPGTADVVMLFTKAYQIRDVLTQNRGLIGPDTMLLTLQNGAGHDRVMREFADSAHVLIGTTKQGSYRESASVIVNSGLGETVFGSAAAAGEQGPDPERLREICSVFENAGFPCAVSENIRFEVWNKLMINASSSVLSGVLQVPQGYVAEDESAWSVCEDLIREICTVAAGEGAVFDPEEQILRVREHLRNAPDGYTSIYADIKNGRKTEADFICGAVVCAAQDQGIRVPVQETILRLVHAMEGR